MKNFVQQAERFALPVGCICTVICLICLAGAGMRPQVFNAWMFAWLFWLGVSLGSMALTMMHYLTGGGWGILIRPITMSAARVLPLMFLLFIPIFFGMRILFPWAQTAELANDQIVSHLRLWLNPSFFAIRWILYFAIWIGMVWGLIHSPDDGLRRRISAGGLVIYVLLLTLAGVDWIMSRQAHWSTTVFGFILAMAESLTALCFTVVILQTRIDRPRIAAFVKPKHFVDLGNMLLMFVILWAYMNFSQFLITWTGNEQPDLPWYVQRTTGGWRVLAGIVVYINFLVMLVLLLMRPLKRNLHRLSGICAAMFVLRILDVYWNIGPQVQADPHGGFVISPFDFLAWLGIGGLWFAVFTRILNSAPDLALAEERDERLIATNPA